MITLDDLLRVVTGVRAEDLRLWIANEWVRPQGGPGDYRFEDIDVARVRLIVVLHYELAIDSEALPVVLSLLDQLHDTRRQMQRVMEVMSEVLPEESRRIIQARLSSF